MGFSVDLDRRYTLPETLRRGVCWLIGHRLAWKHPQQEACFCPRCAFIVDRHGESHEYRPEWRP